MFQDDKDWLNAVAAKNIVDIFITDPVFHDDKDRLNNDADLNMLVIFVTDDVSHVEIEELLNRYLNEMGAECLMDKIQSYPFECSEYNTRSILGSRLDLMRDKALLSIETAYHLQIGTTSLYLVKANDKARCFLSLMKVNEAI